MKIGVVSNFRINRNGNFAQRNVIRKHSSASNFLSFGAVNTIRKEKIENFNRRLKWLGVDKTNCNARQVFDCLGISYDINDE